MRSKKIKLSIMKRIAILFSVALILSVPITMALNHKFMMKNAAMQAGETAGVAAAGARAYLEDMADYEDLMKDAKISSLALIIPGQTM